MLSASQIRAIAHTIAERSKEELKNDLLHIAAEVEMAERELRAALSANDRYREHITILRQR